MSTDDVAAAQPAELDPAARQEFEQLVRFWNVAIVLTLAAAPSILVVRDRWQDHSGVRNLLRESVWCRIPALCESAWPSYFILVLACLAGLLALFLVPWFGLGAFVRGAAPAAMPVADPPISSVGPPPRQMRRAKLLLFASGIGFAAIALRTGLALTRPRPESGYVLPSWDLVLVLVGLVAGALLLSVPVATLKAAWQQQRDRWLSMAAVHLALVMVLFTGFGLQQGVLFSSLLALCVVAAVWPSLRATGPAFWIQGLALVLFTLFINAWWYAVIGDEYSFLYEARILAQQRPIAEIVHYLFEGTYVYGAHPFISTLIQAAFVKAFGASNFGWRFANVYLSALALVFLYAFIKTFAGRWLAALTALFLAASHYLMSFGKIGYNNLQAFFVQAVLLAATAWAIRSRSPIASVVLGLAMGSCFYVYPAALYCLPLSLLLLVLYDPPRNRAAIRRWGTTAVSAAVLVSPLLIQLDYWQAKILGTLYAEPDLADTTGSAAAHVGYNLMYAAFSFLYAIEETHFVAVSHVDPITGALVFVGLVCTLARLRYDRFARFMLLGFAMLIVLVGATHDRLSPPTTRMFLLLPWYAWFAALGLAWVVETLGGAFPHWSQSPGGRRVFRVAIPLLVIAPVIVANGYQAHVLGRQRMAGRYQLRDSTFVRLATQVAEAQTPGQPPPTFVFFVDPDHFDIRSPRTLVELHRLPFAPGQMVMVDALKIEPTRPRLSAVADEWVVDANNVVLMSMDLDQAHWDAVTTLLTPHDRTACEIKNEADQVRLVLWHTPDQKGLCEWR